MLFRSRLAHELIFSGHGIRASCALLDRHVGSHARVDTADADDDGNTTEILIGPNKAALDLGILGENDPADDTTDEVPDNEIEGAQLGGVDPLDRFFVRDAEAAARFQISTPELNAAGEVIGDDGLDAALRFGFVELAEIGRASCRERVLYTV